MTERPTGRLQLSPSAPVRVVSLVPSMTETLLAWGVRPCAVTRFCEAPGIEAVGGTKNPDVAAIEALRPDLVLMDEEENRLEDAEALRAAGLRVVATRIRSVADVHPALEMVAEAVGVPTPAGTGAPDPPAQAGPAGRAGEAAIPVFVPIWRRPWMTVTGPTYGSSVLAAAGMHNVFAGPDQPAPSYPEVDIESVIARQPRFVLAPSEPYRFSERHRPELSRMAPVVFVDGQDLFWWGARTAEAIARLEKLAAGLRQR